MANPADDPDSGYVLIGAGGGKALLFHEGRCVHCGSCVTACRNGALAIVSFFGETRLVPTPSKCCGCFKCVKVCAAEALVQQG
ncbi:MAG: 4Fe-4S binding protein [Campylobacteraceae bacterium]|jgi:NAD-dependent dihydropyrimidine dehydrogenase PreA subunit|nr:4Fe-4S binding protein [Campylobacteraceae bacterium]